MAADTRRGGKANWMADWRRRLERSQINTDQVSILHKLRPPSISLSMPSRRQHDRQRPARLRLERSQLQGNVYCFLGYISYRQRTESFVLLKPVYKPPFSDTVRPSAHCLGRKQGMCVACRVANMITGTLGPEHNCEREFRDLRSCSVP